VSVLLSTAFSKLNSSFKASLNILGFEQKEERNQKKEMFDLLKTQRKNFR